MHTRGSEEFDLEQDGPSGSCNVNVCSLSLGRDLRYASQLIVAPVQLFNPPGDVYEKLSPTANITVIGLGMSSLSLSNILRRLSILSQIAWRTFSSH